MNGQDKKFNARLKLAPYKSVLITVAAAFGITFFTEISSRRSLIDAIVFTFTRPHLFMLNMAIVFFVFTFSLLFKKRKIWLLFLATLWAAFGITDFVVRCFRVTPFAATDFALLESVWSVMLVYLKTWQIILISAVILAALGVVIFLFIKSKKENVDFRIAACSIAIGAILVFGLSTVYNNVGVIPRNFSNLPDAYDGYGFSYCFTVGIFDRGIDRPDDYSKENVEEILNSIGASKLNPNMRKPNIIFLQLESFFDVNYLKNVEFSEDPVPNFTALKKKYTNGFLSVPSIGSGTANTEFEVLTGMCLDFFGTAEYPYKTVLQDNTCETVAYNLKEQGYSCHAIHNHAGTFYDRNFVYSHLGFDTFTSLEYMVGSKENPIGWAEDKILTGEILKTLNSTPGKDLIYAISVQAHGKYPSDKTSAAMPIEVYGIENQSLAAEYKYFVNQLRDTDAFVGALINALQNRPDPYVVVMFGDHLPSLDLTEEDITNGDLFDTEYILWSNYEMEREVVDLEAYQLSAYVMERVGFSNGIFTKLHQNYSENENYYHALEMLEYDVLYGDYDAYNGKQKYQATDLKMGSVPIEIENVTMSEDELTVIGKNFTEFSVIVLNGKRVKTEFVSEYVLKTAKGVIKGNDDMPEKIAVAQITKNGEFLTEVHYKAK